MLSSHSLLSERDCAQAHRTAFHKCLHACATEQRVLREYHECYQGYLWSRIIFNRYFKIRESNGGAASGWAVNAPTLHTRTPVKTVIIFHIASSDRDLHVTTQQVVG